MSRRDAQQQSKATKKGAAPAPARASRGPRVPTGRRSSRRIPMPTCRDCDTPLSRKEKNAGHVICAGCERRVEKQRAEMFGAGAGITFKLGG